MSQVHRVILLNEPYKLSLLGFSYTLAQWAIMFLSFVLAFVVGFQIPPQIKIGNLPLCFLVGLGIFCAGMVLVQSQQMKAFAWWKNMFRYRLGLIQKVYLPTTEDGTIYPDPTVIDEDHKKQEEFYVK